MKFSVVVPVYGVEPYLRQCVDSILSQSDPDFELILVDDGSPDGCPAICDAYAGADPRVRVLHQANRGLSAARNAGIQAAAGRYLLLVDSDDFWPEPDMLGELSRLIEAHSADVVLFRVRAWFSETDRSRVKTAPFDHAVLDRFDHDATLHYLLSTPQFPVGVYSLCVERSLLEANHIAFREGVKSEDYDWLLAVLRDSGRIYASDAVYYVYRADRPGSITKHIDLKHLQDLTDIAAGWTEAPGFAAPCLRRDVKNYAAYIFTTALVVSGRVPKAQRRDAVKLLRSHRKLLQNACWWRLRVIRLSTQLVGFRLTTAILHKLYQWKRNKEFQ